MCHACGDALLGFTQKVFVTEDHQTSDFIISFVDSEVEADWVWSLTTDVREATFDEGEAEGLVYFAGTPRNVDMRVTIVSHPYYAEKRFTSKQGTKKALTGLLCLRRWNSSRVFTDNFQPLRISIVFIGVIDDHTDA